VAEAPGLGAGVDDVRAVGEAVDDGLREPGVGEDLRPLAEREVGGDDQRAAFVALAEDLEDEFGGAVGQREVAEFVNLCGYPHSVTYADTATMPNVSHLSPRICLLIAGFSALALARMSA
jgi:hypothetical protein